MKRAKKDREGRESREMYQKTSRYAAVIGSTGRDKRIFLSRKLIQSDN